MMRRLPLVALLVLAGHPSQRSAPVRFELPNGLRVWVQEDHSRPVVLVQTTYKVGSINDGPGTTGTAHYVEHMVYRATQNIRNEDIYGFIDRVGGRYTGGTAQLATTYTETVPSWALEEALRTNAERMGRALFDSLEFERERTNVITEANGYVATAPAQILRDEVLSASFTIHPYRLNSATWAQDNLVLRRSQAWEFYRSYYGPNNAVLAVVGDVRADDVRRLVEQHFGPLAPAPLSGEVGIVEPPQRAEKRVVLVVPDSQSHLEIMYRAPQASHADYPVLAVLDRLLLVRLRAALAAAGAGDVATSQSATPYPFVYRISVSAPPPADLERLTTVVQGEIDRLARNGADAAELSAARIERAPGGRGGRGGGGGSSAQQGGTPPRQSNLTQIATQLTAREVFPQDVSAELRERIRRAQESVTAGEVRAYVDRWLRVSQRTVGFHVPGKSGIRPEWTNAREVTGDRLVIPPLTTPPAKREPPTPVPPAALRPLENLALATGRRALANGVVVRAARVPGSETALQVRVRLDAVADPIGKGGLAAFTARLIAADSVLQSLGARASTAALANDAYFDILLSVPDSAAATASAEVARALRLPGLSAERVDAARRVEGRGPAAGRGAGGTGVAAEARARVLREVAPGWSLSAPGTPETVARITTTDVRDFVARHLMGGAVTVSLAGPADPEGLLGVGVRAFSRLPAGRRVGAVVGASGTRAGAAGGHVVTTQPAAPPVEEQLHVASEAQVAVVAGLPLPGVSRVSPSRRALELLNYIVGVPSYGGRLGWALTKTGLTYSSSATTTIGATGGHLLFTTRCDTRNLGSTIQAIREVIAGVGERGVDEWELREAQAFTLGRALLYGPRDDSGAEAIATALLDSETSGEELLDLPALSRHYLDVSLAEVNAVARRFYRPELLKVVAIGAVPDRPARAVFPPGTFRSLFEP